MFARSTSGGAVCLRCRLHLLPLDPRLIQAANYGLHRRHNQRCFSSDSDTDPGDNGSDDPPNTSRKSNFGDFENAFIADEGTAEWIRNRPRRRPHNQPIQPSLDRPPPNFNRPNFLRARTHKAGNRLLAEASESLGRQMLGKPAHAIVMKERALKKKVLQTLPEDEVSRTELADFLANNAGPASPEEARSNIDELKPAFETSLPQREFRKLQFMLTEGFISPQLTDYIKNYKKHPLPQEDSNQSIEKPVKVIAEYGWLKSVSPWVPVRQDTSDSESNAYMSASNTAKERLAIKIIRDCWQITIQEFSAGLGEVEVKIKPTEFALLTGGQQRFLNNLAEKWLDAGEKIEAFPERNTVKITSAKPKTDFLLGEIDTTLQRIETKTIPLNIISPDPIGDNFLDEVGNITKTLVKRSRTLKRIHVTWVGLGGELKKRYDKVEDLRHTVFRLLLTSFGGRAPITSLHAPKATDASTGRYVVDKTSYVNWSWKSKLEQWARYTVPAEAQSSAPRPVRVVTDEQEHPANFIHELPIPIMTSQGSLLEAPAVSPDNHEFYLDTPYPAHPVQWADGIETTTVAQFGHILHKHEHNAPAPSSLSELLTANHPRIFSPTTPHPIRVAQLKPAFSLSPSPVETKSSILIRFWPSPSPRSSPTNDDSDVVSSGDLSPTAAPVLELRLSITDDDYVSGVESFRAVLSTSTTDILLPASMSDLRFTSTRTCDLVPGDARIEGAGGSSYNSLLTWQPLRTFLQHARLELTKGNLEMPPRQRFPIPRRLFAGWEGGKGTGDELQSVTYEYVGLELQRSVALAHKGWKTTYTAIEAGQGGGRRTELAMEPVVITSSPAPGSQEAIADNEAEKVEDKEEESHDNDSVEQQQQRSLIPEQNEAQERENYLLSLIKKSNETGGEAEKDELRRDFLSVCHSVATSEQLWTGVPLERPSETNSSR